MKYKADEMLERGAALLDPLLVAHGFSFKLVDKGNSSGGPFCSGEFRKEERRLELHFRDSLGMVRYHLAACSMSHLDYVRSVIGKPNLGHYPGFSDDPIDGFRHLLFDLQEHGADFLSGTNVCLQNRIELANNLPPVKSGLPD
jgi:hypothetical protein